MVEYRCDVNNCKRKPVVELYPYDRKNHDFIGIWCYACFWHFLLMKLREKLRLEKRKFAWCKAERCDDE